MSILRFLPALLLAALGSACAPLPLAPTALVETAPQGATFFADALQDLPLVPAPLPLDPPRPSPLDGGALCGGEAGERAHAQCLRGEGWDTAPSAAPH